MKMKRKILSLLLAAFMVISLLPMGAQPIFALLPEGIPINEASFPDANFRAWLQDSTNINGAGSDDILTPTEIAAITSINVSNKSISNLEGIGYFTALTNLDCSNNSLTLLPALPYTLEALICYNSSLTALPSLPPSLINLYCANNSLTALPELPSRLIVLECSNNSLPALRLNSSAAYAYINVSNNYMTGTDKVTGKAITWDNSSFIFDPQNIDYTVTVQSEGGGTASASPASAAAGTEINLTATPNSGKQFKEWQVISGTVTISGNKFTMPAENVTVKAIFENIPATITSVTVSPSTVSVQKGKTQGFTATVTGTGSFDNTVAWSVTNGTSGTTSIDPTGLLTVAAGETATSLTVKATANGDSTKSAIASVTVTDTPITKHTLTVTSGTGDGEFAEGTVVTITANAPAPGKEFDKWTTSSGGTFANVSSSTTTFTMPAAAVTVTATYKDKPITTYTVTFNLNGGTHTGGGALTQIIAEGGNATAPTVTRSGYTFAGWDKGFTNVTANLTVTATWTSSGGGDGSSYTNYTITASSDKGGSITPSGSVSVREKTDKTFSILAVKGYVISDVLVDGKSVGAVKTYTFTNISKAHTIVAKFAEEEKTDPSTGVKIPFDDVKAEDWFAGSVMWAYENGLMVGTSPTSFSPNLQTTRGMIVTILHRLEESPKGAGADIFADVVEGKWYSDAIAWAAENKIAAGYGDGKFGPEDSITREQMAVILMNYAKLKGYDVSAKADLSIFTDSSEVSGWAADALAWANAKGLINGMSNEILAPQGLATRAQVAAILHRFIEKFK